MLNTAVELNGRSYGWPRTPVVAVCIDGSEPGYIEAAVSAGLAPFFERIMAEGSNRIARCVVPSFTNPNNLSIVTGADQRVTPLTKCQAPDMALVPCKGLAHYLPGDDVPSKSNTVPRT